jgi:hypothetical protein
MAERFAPTNELEELLLTHSTTLATLGVFLQRLMVSKVVVLVRQGSEGATYPMKITGANGTPVVALFTSADRATVWAERYEEYRTAVVVDARWALSRIEAGCGIAVNPGHPVGFEVSAEGLPKLLLDFGVVKEER